MKAIYDKEAAWVREKVKKVDGKEPKLLLIPLIEKLQMEVKTPYAAADAWGRGRRNEFPQDFGGGAESLNSGRALSAAGSSHNPLEPSQPRGLRCLGVYTANAQPALPRAVALADQLRQWDLPDLESLELHDCALDTDQAMALTEAQLPRLTVLGLTGNDLTGLDVAQFLSSPLVQQIHTLSISNTGVERELLLAVLDWLAGRGDGKPLALRRIRAHRAWSEDELRTVVNHPAYRQLEQVDLGISQVPEAAWLALLD